MKIMHFLLIGIIGAVFVLPLGAVASGGFGGRGGLQPVTAVAFEAALGRVTAVVGVAIVAVRGEVVVGALGRITVPLFGTPRSRVSPRRAGFFRTGFWLLWIRVSVVVGWVLSLLSQNKCINISSELIHWN